jgi:diketogulonate reductase-like aldo/keto reductase
MSKKIAIGTSLFQNNSDCDIIRYAIDLGVSVVDTAENYGMSEKIVANAIRDIRDRIAISTKFSPENSKYNDVIKAAHRSLKNLQTDSIDIYYVHWPRYDIDFSETYKALSDLKESGKIKQIGLCNVNRYDLSLFLDIGPIDCIQMEYNLFDRWASPVLFHGSIANKFCYSSLDQGIICDSKNKELNCLAEKYNVSVPAVVLSWEMSKNLIPIFASKNSEHIKDNISSLSVTLSDTDVEFLDRIGSAEVMVNIRDIIPADGGHRNRKTYKTVDEAIKNHLNYYPSPMEMSKRLQKCRDIKPIKLSRNNDGSYTLIEGRVRYWAWRLAFGDDCTIPSLIRQGTIS